MLALFIRIRKNILRIHIQQSVHMTGHIEKRNNFNALLVRILDNSGHLCLGQIAAVTAAVLGLVARNNSFLYFFARVRNSVRDHDGHIVQQEAQAGIAHSQLQLVVVVLRHHINERFDTSSREILSAAVQMHDLVEIVIRTLSRRSVLRGIRSARAGHDDHAQERAENQQDG